MHAGSGQCAPCGDPGFSVSGIAMAGGAVLYAAYVAAVWGWMAEKLDVCFAVCFLDECWPPGRLVQLPRSSVWRSDVEPQVRQNG